MSSNTRKAVSRVARKSNQALVCNKCSSEIIAEYDLITNAITLYDFAPYLEDIRVNHRHTCDAQTRVRVLEMVATEKRLLEDMDPDDCLYTVKEICRRGARRSGSTW